MKLQELEVLEQISYCEVYKKLWRKDLLKDYLLFTANKLESIDPLDLENCNIPDWLRDIYYEFQEKLQQYKTDLFYKKYLWDTTTNDTL